MSLHYQSFIPIFFNKLCVLTLALDVDIHVLLKDNILSLITSRTRILRFLKKKTERRN